MQYFKSIFKIDLHKRKNKIKIQGLRSKLKFQ